jgi:hypothetical protein
MSAFALSKQPRRNEGIVQQLERRIAKLEAAVPHRVVVVDERRTDRDLRQLIANLPPEAQVGALAIVENARERLSAAAAVIPAIHNGHKTKQAVIMDALHATERRDRLAAYLAQGRYFVATSDDELRSMWVSLMGAWLRNGRPIRYIDDIASELGIRGLDPPLDAVRDEIDVAYEKVKDDPDLRTSVRRELRAFLDRLDEFCRAASD